MRGTISHLNPSSEVETMNRRIHSNINPKILKNGLGGGQGEL